MDVATGSVRHIAIFAGLPEDALRDIASRCRATLYPARSEIISHLSPSTDLYLLVSGAVRATVFSPRGKEVAFRDLHEGEIFGELSAIDGAPRSATVVSMSDAVVLTLSGADFRAVYRRYPDVAEALLKTMTHSVRALSSRVFEFSTLSAADRVLIELLRLAEASEAQDGDAARIAAPPTHEDLAKLINTQRETVTKELSRARRNGLLATDPEGGWLVPSVTRLRTHCGID